MKIVAAALMIALVAPFAAACGSDSEDPGGATVSATTGILADITEQIAGEDADVVQVIPEGSSPHDFQLSAQDRAAIADSVLLVHNGADLESGVPVDEIGGEQFALTDNVGELLPFEEAGAHEAEHDKGEVHSEDPHVWMDPSRVAAAMPALADALAEADPDNADAYRRRAEVYAAQLTALDAEIEQQLAAIPADSRELVTSHDALGYFADRYRFEVVATPFPASGPEAEASAARINEVQEAVRRTGVPTLFAEQEDDPEVLELIANEAGVEVVDGLLVESPGDAGSYVEMLRSDAQLIRDGLPVGNTGQG